MGLWAKIEKGVYDGLEEGKEGEQQDGPPV